MKGTCNLLWIFFSISLAATGSGYCLADSEIQNATPTSNTDTASQSDSLWKIPEPLSKWELPETMQIHGFASQSYIYTTGNNFFGHSTNTGSLDFTEMGINGSWRPLPQLQTSLQIVYRRAGKTDDSNLRIDFGFLDYNFVSDAKKLLGIRLGRVVNPFGLYNDVRDMPFTRPSIFLPQSIYFDANRNFALSGDGIQIYGEQRNGFGDFFLQANGFYPRTDDPDLKIAIVGPKAEGKMNAEPSWVVRLMYEWEAGRVRLGVTGGTLKAKYEPTAIPGNLNFDPGSFAFSSVLFSAQYNAENWSLTSEYALRQSDLREFGVFFPDTTFTGESYYVQGSYRFLEKLEAFIRYDALFWDKSDRNGEQFAAKTKLPASNRFAKDITTGLRWDITPSVMARMEYHYINGTGWTSNLENKDGVSQYWHMVAASLSFRF